MWVAEAVIAVHCARFSNLMAGLVLQEQEVPTLPVVLDR